MLKYRHLSIKTFYLKNGHFEKTQKEGFKHENIFYFKMKGISMLGILLIIK